MINRHKTLKTISTQQVHCEVISAGDMLMKTGMYLLCYVWLLIRINVLVLLTVYIYDLTHINISYIGY